MSHSSHRKNYQIDTKKEHIIKKKTHETNKELDTTKWVIKHMYISGVYSDNLRRCS